MSNVRIKDLATDSALAAGDYIIVDSDAEGTRKYDIGSGLAGKVNKPAGNGTSGQVLKTNGDGTTQWANESGGGGSITVDSALSSSSENPVQNKVIEGISLNFKGALTSSDDLDNLTQGIYTWTTSVPTHAPTNAGNYGTVIVFEGVASSSMIYDVQFCSMTSGRMAYRRKQGSSSGDWAAWREIQHTDNLVTSLSSSSTDAQYPSAKCVYDGLGEKQNATTIVSKTSSDTSQTLAENTFYVWPEMSALTITCPSTGGPYAFRFTSGSTATTLTMTGITMPDSFTVEANKVYEINVFQGYGLAASWAVSA